MDSDLEIRQFRRMQRLSIGPICPHLGFRLSIAKHPYYLQEYGTNLARLVGIMMTVLITFCVP